MLHVRSFPPRAPVPSLLRLILRKPPPEKSGTGMWPTIMEAVSYRVGKGSLQLRVHRTEFLHYYSLIVGLFVLQLSVYCCPPCVFLTVFK